MRISRENIDAIKGYNRWAPVVPEGWTKLGAGSSRTAFLGPDGLVYKVSEYEDYFQNRNEGKVVWTWRKRADLPSWAIVPRAHFDEDSGVLVMEYHEGSQPNCSHYGCSCGQEVCWVKRLRELAQLGWCDMQTANAVLAEDGRVVLIDLGCDG
jgi:hypothetical protein